MGSMSMCYVNVPFRATTTRQEHPLVVSRIGYGAEEAMECRTAQAKALRRAQEAVVSRGGFDWQLFTEVNAVTNETCLDRMRAWCSPPRYQMRVALQMNVYAGEEHTAFISKCLNTAALC